MGFRLLQGRDHLDEAAFEGQGRAMGHPVEALLQRDGIGGHGLTEGRRAAVRKSDVESAQVPGGSAVSCITDEALRGDSPTPGRRRSPGGVVIRQCLQRAALTLSRQACKSGSV